MRGYGADPQLESCHPARPLIASIGRTGFWNNLVVRPHPEQEGRYQLAYGHNRIAACRKAGITEAELEVIDLGDYDMLCCMVDENLTQQHIAPKTIFEIVAAAVKEAEKMLRATKTVYEFNAHFKRSKGLPSLLHDPRCSGWNNGPTWREDEYTKAKLAIEPSGNGLGRGFIQHFLPDGTGSRAETMQTALTAYYQERWKQEGQDLRDKSQLMLWQAKETNDQEKILEALELEKQALVLFGKVKQGGISRTLLCSLSNNEKASDPEAAGRKKKTQHGDYYCSGHSGPQL